MTNIISMSIDKNLLEELDKTQKNLGFPGRSEIIRTALTHFLAEQKNLEKTKGKTEAILLVKHKENHKKSLTSVWHNYQNIIKTQLHHHLKSHHCLELFLLEGEAKVITELVKNLKKEKTTNLVKLIAL